MTHDLSFFLDPPDLTARAVLTVEALAPLSMVAELPGHYFRSQPAPTDAMLLGLFENALGWHFDDATRRDALKALAKEARKRHRKGPWKDHPWLSGKTEGPTSGYLPLLSHHVTFETTRILPPVMTYDDLWSQNLHDPASQNFFGGSRHYDGDLDGFVIRTRDQDPEKPINPKTKKRPSRIEATDKGEKVLLSLPVPSGCGDGLAMSIFNRCGR